MNTVHVNVGKGYDVTIGSGLLPICGTMAARLMEPCKAAIICGSNVAPLYLKTTADSFAAGGFKPFSMVYPAGERSKTLSTLSDILEFMAQSRLTRADLVVALGGGVTGDMAGFAAGVYLRGIKYIQLPTTFLGAVDSSVGGKTAVDLQAGKNLAGVFLQPEAVICDTACFTTLPPEIFACGTAEALKTGILSGRELFSLFENDPAALDINEIITRCVKYKAGVVERDEFESGERKLLNLGHTTAHAIEKLSDYKIPHGMAVSVGLAVIARASCAIGICTPQCRDEIISALEKQGLPATTFYSAEHLSEAALTDKKRSGDNITLVLPTDIGSCIYRSFPVSKLREIISLGLN